MDFFDFLSFLINTYIHAYRIELNRIVTYREKEREKKEKKR